MVTSTRIRCRRRELDTYRRHPDTFFGVPGQRRTRANTLMELYDFFHDTYRKTPKDTLLTFVRDWPDSSTLAVLDQAELASVYAERMAIGASQNLTEQV